MKKLTTSACLACVLLVFSFEAQAKSCNIKRGDEVVRITKVIDGDTVINHRNERMRLVGINTPEKVRHKKRNNPMAQEALDQLERWVLERRVLVEYDEERIDPHGRLLVHLHDRYGNINARLVREGFAWQAVVPPNLKHLDCYYKQEQLAREEIKGVWKFAEYAAVPAKPSLLDPQLGFLRIIGVVEAVENRAGSNWLMLGNRISARIPKESTEYFEDFDLAGLEGQEVTLRGWVFALKSHRVAFPSIIIEIDHPLMIENIDALLGPATGVSADSLLVY